MKRLDKMRWLALAAVSAGLSACQGAAAPEAIGSADEAVLSYSSDQGTVDYANATFAAGTVSAGTVMNSPFTVHFIFYGSGFSQTQQQIVEDFATGLSGSPLMNVLSSYYDPSFVNIPTTFNFDTWFDTNYSAGPLVHPTQAIVDNAITNLGAPNNPNDVYIILFDQFSNSVDANMNPVGCGAKGTPRLCGAHGHDDDFSQGELKFAWIANPAFCANNHLNSCVLSQYTTYGNSPNGDVNIDSMVEVVYHELAETLTNPHSNGWHAVVSNPAGGDLEKEVADMCEGSHVTDSLTNGIVGPVQLDLDYNDTMTGAPANVRLGTRDFIMQPIWQNAERGGCVRRLALTRPTAQAAWSSGVAAGDFNGDLVGDILWRNSDTGNVSIWLMSSTGVRSSYGTPITGLSGRMQVVGVADFNGDKKSDILFSDVGSGLLLVDYMNGVNIASSSILFGALPTGVLEKAVGDFDGDGKADILFMNMSTNETRVWYNGSGLNQYSALPILTPAAGQSDNLETVGTGNFGGGSKADVLWHDLVHDTYFFWSFNGSTVTTTQVPTSGVAYLYGLLDVDNDGTTDLVGASTDGTSVVWVRMVNGQAQPAAVIQGLPDPEWRFSGGGNLGPLGQAGIYWRNRHTGAVSIWYLTTQGKLSSSVAVANPPTLHSEITAY